MPVIADALTYPFGQAVEVSTHELVFQLLFLIPLHTSPTWQLVWICRLRTSYR